MAMGPGAAHSPPSVMATLTRDADANVDAPQYWREWDNGGQHAGKLLVFTNWIAA